MNKYLKLDPLPLLLDPSDPVLRYRTLRDVCGDAVSPEFLTHEYNSLRQSDYITDILASAGNNGVLGDTAHFDTYYRGTYWKFSEAVHAGLDCSEPVIASTAKYIIENYQHDSGCFVMNTSPMAGDACITGEIVSLLLRAGFHDDRIQLAIQWIIAHQRHDGGWLFSPCNSSIDIVRLLLFRRPGSPQKHDSNISRHSCVYASIACADALSLYKAHDSTVRHSIEKALEYFLEHRLFSNMSDKNAASHLRKNSNSNFSVPGYPLFCQYDILRGLHFLADNSRFDDRRSGEAFNHIVSLQDDRGILHVRGRRKGLFSDWRGAQSRDRHSKWATLNLLRLLQKTGHYTCEQVPL